jgi:hypothetical protein
MAKSGVNLPPGTTIAVRQLQVGLSAEQTRILDFLFDRSRALYNQALYATRRSFFKTGFIPKKGTLFFRDDVKVRGFREQPPRKKPGHDELLTVNPKPHPWTIPLKDRFVGGALDSLDGSVHRKTLPASVANQVLWSVHEAWDSYRELRALHAIGTPLSVQEIACCTQFSPTCMITFTGVLHSIPHRSQRSTTIDNVLSSS